MCQVCSIEVYYILPTYYSLPINIYFMQVNIYDVNGGIKTEVHKKVILQVYIYELHIDILKKCSTGFSMVYDEKDF